MNTSQSPAHTQTTPNARLPTKGLVPTPIAINICTFPYFEQFNGLILTRLPICSWPLPLSRHRSLAWHLGGGLDNAIHDLIRGVIRCVGGIVIASVPRADTAWKGPASEFGEKKRGSLLSHFGFAIGFSGKSQQAAQSSWLQFDQRRRICLMENISK